MDRMMMNNDLYTDALKYKLLFFYICLVLYDLLDSYKNKSNERIFYIDLFV